MCKGNSNKSSKLNKNGASLPYTNITVGFASNNAMHILGHCQYNIDTFLNVEENTKISKHICSPSWKLLWFTMIPVYVIKNGGFRINLKHTCCTSLLY
jgi:hypothetical protein